MVLINHDTRRKLGLKIRELRKLMGYTQEELNEKSNVSAKFIGEIERGEVNPSLESLIRIASALNINVRDLFPDEKSMLLCFSPSELKLVRKATGILYRKLK
jgi:transcriptional regulator with XRE-family HTH domain